jgi:hypothetical protein
MLFNLAPLDFFFLLRPWVWGIKASLYFSLFMDSEAQVYKLLALVD